MVDRVPQHPSHDVRALAFEGSECVPAAFAGPEGAGLEAIALEPAFPKTRGDRDGGLVRHRQEGHQRRPAGIVTVKERDVEDGVGQARAHGRLFFEEAVQVGQPRGFDRDLDLVLGDPDLGARRHDGKGRGDDGDDEMSRNIGFTA